MATLYLTESPGVVEDSQGKKVPVFDEPDTAPNKQAVTFTTATQSTAFKGETRIIRFYGSVAFNLEIGTNPTATASSPRYAATTEYFRGVRGGQKLSVYDGSS